MTLLGGTISITGVAFLMLCIFAITAVGYSIGRISIKGVNLGTAGVFIVALLFGCFFFEPLKEQLMMGGDTKISYVDNALKIIETFGLILFVTSVGFIAGPTCLIFFVASAIPTNAGDFGAFDGIFGGTWFILLGSTVAFLASAAINNSLNWLIGKSFCKKPDGKLAYAARTYVSTFVGQFLDNFIFSVIVFVFFAPIFWNGFHWTVLQCVTCALTGAVAELIMEIAFSPIGYRITKRWTRDKVGEEYLNFIGRIEN